MALVGIVVALVGIGVVLGQVGMVGVVLGQVGMVGVVWGQVGMVGAVVGLVGIERVVVVFVGKVAGEVVVEFVGIGFEARKVEVGMMVVEELVGIVEGFVGKVVGVIVGFVGIVSD
uniref:Uncharacterized protein n=1 Tax=Arcella intermedia TaxID=1963864 RepID=A0A6B2LN40_9EUKA